MNSNVTRLPPPPPERRRVLEQHAVLQEIYNYFLAHATWPTFISIDRPLRRDYDVDTAAIILTLPESVIVRPRPGNIRPVAGDELRLRLLGIHACRGGSDDTERFVRTLRWLAQQEMSYEPEPDSDETMPRVTSDNVAAYLGLRHDDLAVARLYAMLQLDNWGIGASGSGEDGWFVTLTPDIWRFRDVQTVEDCMRVREEWDSEARELLTRDLITEPPTSAVEPPAALNQVAAPVTNSYVDQRIIDGIRAKDSKSQFDVSKLLKLIEELNDNYEQRNSYATHMLIRAILDHIPPIFEKSDFNEVANNVSWGRTDKRYLKRLADFRNQADDALHRQISPQSDVLDFDDVPASVCVNRLLQECATRLLISVLQATTGNDAAQHHILCSHGETA